MLPIGTILDSKWKIIQVLSDGERWRVYKGEQIDSPGQFCVMKEILISPSIPEYEHQSFIERFQKQFNGLSHLKHPHIASLLGNFQERGNYYVIMEFVQGKSLESILDQANAPLPEEQVIKWMMQVCEALTYLHTQPQPIILRDFKPDGLLITPDDTAQLIELGIQVPFNRHSKRRGILGTISYASPEFLGSITAPRQRRSAPSGLVQPDARSDVYSLGVMMCHLLTHYEPDPIQTPASEWILSRNPHLSKRSINGRLVCLMEQIIIKAMQQEPAQRFQTAEALRHALAQSVQSMREDRTNERRLAASPDAQPDMPLLQPVTQSAIQQTVQESIKVFLSYSHRDDIYRQELEKYLTSLRRKGLITSWYDGQIKAGDLWEKQISEQLQQARIIIVLISQDFLHSPYCYEKELLKAMERHDAGQARVIPILVRPSLWEDSPFGVLQVLPEKAIPISRAQDRDEVYVSVAKSIQTIVEDLLISDTQSVQKASKHEY